MPVIVDTSEWAQYYRVAASQEAMAVRSLIEAGDAVMVGVVYAELLRGARDEAQARILEDELDALPFIETNKRTWAISGQILADLSRRGLVVPLPDAVISALAIENDLMVFSRDEHFRRIPDLKLYSPGPS